jgi:ABC-2 type transport system permease protein
VSGAVLAAWILLRMVANSGDSRTWLGWFTPPGWTDQVRSFGDNRWPVLLVPLTVSAGLVAVAVLLRRRRDTGAGILAGRESHRSRALGLGGPTAFAWRASQGVLLAWAVALAAVGAVVGVLLPTMTDYLEDDAGFRDLLAAMGMDATDLAEGFIAFWAVVLGVVVAVYAAFRLGAVRAEEASGRAELLLTRPVTRRRWLGGHLLCLVGSVVVLCTAAAGALWLGAFATGASLGAADAFAAVFNTLPAVAVIAGLSVLVLGLAPRLTVAVGATLAGASYVVELVGPMLHWPEWVLTLSPFHHLAQVPVESFDLTAALVMVAVALAAAAAGTLVFGRRDLVGA